MTTIIGFSCWYHDSAVAVVRDGVVVCAAQEERFSRNKGDAAFPEQALRYCMAAAGIACLEDVDHFVFYEKPFIKFERLIETYLSNAPYGLTQFCKSMPGWIKQKLMARISLERSIRKLFDDKKTAFPALLFNDHHASHAAMAFFPSPFADAAILCLDGVGEWATSSAWTGKGNHLEPVWQMDFPHSLGLLYSAFTSFCGFKVNDGEYKLMGLAPYGTPIYAELIERELIEIRADGSFRLNMHYFSYQHGLRMSNRRFATLFGGSALPLGDTPGQREMDLAASIQQITEKVLLLAATDVQKRTGLKNICLGGGVALNCVAVAALQRAGIFEQVWVNPAPGDAGSAIGCALSVWHEYLEKPRKLATLACSQASMFHHAYLGSKWADETIQNRLTQLGAQFETLSVDALLQTTAELLAQGKVVGWFQGRMEFGARALGARSILADPRDAEMIRRLNLKIKQRESFRPFAASVLAEKANEWFEMGAAATDSPFMNTIAQVAAQAVGVCLADEQGNEVVDHLHDLNSIHEKRSAIPAVTHVDMTCRIHTVAEPQHPLFYRLISRFEQLTGVPLLVNTSFNVRGEPIVCTPEDAWRCFMNTDMDVLVIGSCVLRKDVQR